jgi:hypothetical protein
MFDVFSTIQIQPAYSLDRVEQLPEIPIEAIDIEFEILKILFSIRIVINLIQNG